MSWRRCAARPRATWTSRPRAPTAISRRAGWRRVTATTSCCRRRRRALATGTLDLAAPPVLLYVERDGLWQLVGVEYALPSVPQDDALSGAVWHTHEASCHYRDFRELPAASARACPGRHPASGEVFVGWHPALAVAHVWAWYPNPDGVFAEANP